MTPYVESERYFELARTIIPGASLTRSKAPGRLFDIGFGPLYAVSGDGCRIMDADGNEFIDLVSALGAISLGYGHPAVTRAACEAIRTGWLPSLPHVLEVKAAETVLQHVAPWATSVKFVKTGSESTQAALMIAQRATGRTPYLRLRGSYHGWHAIWQDGADHVRWFDVGQPMGGVADGAAAIFVEPPRWELWTQAWLEDVRDEAARAGALLVCDEMVYGGRWALGGATAMSGVTPDLACFGKAIGSGAPIACIAGREALAEHGELISGTYSGDVAALAALVATITVYATEPVIETLWARGRQLLRGLREAATVFVSDSMAVFPGAEMQGAPVHQRLRFLHLQPAAERECLRRFSARMAAHGILFHPDVCNVNYAMTEADIERVVEAAILSMRELVHG